MYLLTIISLLLLSGAKQIEGKKKQHTILLPGLIPFIGNTWGLTCNATSHLVVDLFNNQTKHLPDFHIELRIRDELLGMAVVNETLRYVQSFEADVAKGDVHQSPIVLAGHQSDGCLPMAPIAHHIKTIMVGLCASPVLADHDRFPAFYLHVPGGDTFAANVVNFARSVGKWKRMGIIADITCVFCYQVGQWAHKLAIESGIEVGSYQNVWDPAEHSVRSFIDADVRIIYIVAGNPTFIRKVLCAAYSQGMFGPRYVYFAEAYHFYEVDNLPEEFRPGCGRKEISMLYKQILWSNPSLDNPNPLQKVATGVNSQEFDKLLEERIDDTMLADYGNRHLCHDMMLRVLLALDNTDRALRQQNLSLLSYPVDPGFVFKVANESMFNIDFVGLSASRISYSLRGQNDFGMMVMFYWTEARGLHVTHAARIPEDLSKYHRFGYDDLVNFTWPGWNGRPPKYEWLIVEDVVQVGPPIFAAVCILSGLLSIGSLTSMIVELAKRNDLPRFINWKTKTIGNFGCILLNCAAVCLALPSTLVSLKTFEALANVRTGLLLIGLSVVHGVLSFSLECLPSFLAVETVDTKGVTSKSKASSRARSRNRSGMKTNTDAPAPTRRILTTEAMQKVEKRSLLATLAFLGANICILIPWIIVYPMQCRELFLNGGKLIYDDLNDVAIKSWTISCESSTFTYWALALSFFHVVILSLGLLSGYMLKKENAHIAWLGLKSFTLVNAVGILLCVILAVFASDGNATSQFTIVAFALLLLSGATASSWLYSSVRVPSEWGLPIGKEHGSAAQSNQNRPTEEN